jgi:hypothetical protein
MIPLTAYEVKQIINENKAGRKPATILKNQEEEKKNDFVSSLGEDNINRFDEKKKNKNKKKKRKPANNKNQDKAPQGQQGQQGNQGQQNPTPKQKKNE